MNPTFSASMLEQVKFNDQGLIAAIAQDADGQVLMLAWMNKEALQLTLETQRVTYYSRSRQKLWKKGETSGQQQTLISADLDCDGDAILLRVEQKGVACHTGRRSCFYKRLDPKNQEVQILTQPEIDPGNLYAKKGQERKEAK